MGILRFLALALVVIWLVLWLALKITSGLIHLLVIVGLVMLIVSFLKKS